MRSSFYFLGKRPTFLGFPNDMESWRKLGFVPRPKSSLIWRWIWELGGTGGPWWFSRISENYYQGRNGWHQSCVASKGVLVAFTASVFQLLSLPPPEQCISWVVQLCNELSMCARDQSGFHPQDNAEVERFNCAKTTYALKKNIIALLFIYDV